MTTTTEPRVAVYGATGYTGGLTVAELRRRGIATVLIGRDKARLDTAAEAAGSAGSAEVRVAALDDPGALTAALAGCDVVINCAGPFVLWGGPVIRAALDAGCHYVDISGEQTHLADTAAHYADAAADAGVTILTGANDDALTSDLIAALAAARTGPAAAVTIAVDLAADPASAPSRGTLRSLLASPDTFGGGELSWTGGRWHRGVPPRTRELTFPGGTGPVPVGAFPLPGLVSIPRHVATEHLEGVVPAALIAAFTAVGPELVDLVPAGPTAAQRANSRWTIVADVVGTDGRRARGTVAGPDTYGLTAIIAVESALRLAAGGAPAGVPAPAQAVDPASFLDALVPHGVSWTVT
jgi:short subunit dehydrogenase-like uncharacterized protein